jgi:Phytanoyl-CoA dioxygenase (PhyH)
VNRILKDPVLQERFEADGYVRLPLLGKEEIQELTQYYMRHTGGDVKNSVYGMWVSLHDQDDIAFKRQTMDEIRRVTLPRLNEFFIDCKPHLGSYLVKVPNPRSFTFPHQDWTFVDSHQMQSLCSLTVWITLKDVSIAGGTLGFVKGSPKFFDHVIGSPSPAIKTATQGHEPMLFEYLSYESVRAGDALAFNNRTIHAAMPNTTEEQRIALGIGMTPAQADLYHYFLKPGTADRLLKLKVEDEFFVRYSNQALFDLYQQGKTPDYCQVEDELEYRFTPLSPDDMSAMCERHGSVRNGMAVNLRG